MKHLDLKCSLEIDFSKCRVCGESLKFSRYSDGRVKIQDTGGRVPIRKCCRRVTR